MFSQYPSGFREDSNPSASATEDQSPSAEMRVTRSARPARTRLRRRGMPTTLRDTAEQYGGVLYGRAGGTLLVDGNDLWWNTSQLGGALMVWEVRDVAILRNHLCSNTARGGTAPRTATPSQAAAIRTSR